MSVRISKTLRETLVYFSVYFISAT